MWRFILVTFAFLGWSFYVLSGGADYEPRLQSIQVRAKLDDVRPVARPVPVQVAGLDEPDTTHTGEEIVTRAVSTLDDSDLASGDQFEVILASAGGNDVVEPVFETSAEKVENLTQVPVIEIAPEVTLDETDVQGDFRQVTGFIVNLRDGPSTYYLAIAKLQKGEKVEVLDNPGEGWLKIRVAATRQEGWMADWLVTAAAN